LRGEGFFVSFALAFAPLGRRWHEVPDAGLSVGHTVANRSKNRNPSEARADELERYLADEPVAAYPEPWTVRLRRAARKRPSLTAGLAATILVGLLASGLFSVLLSYQNDALATANSQLPQARDRAEANEQKA